MNTKQDIESVINKKKLAFIGVSSDPKKFSRMTYKELKTKGFELYPVNPKMEDVDGDKCYKSIPDLPGDIKWGLFMTPKDETAGAVKQAVESGFESVWIQQGAHSEDAKNIALENNVKLVYNKCIMMFASPVKGVHSFHRFLAKIFGKAPA
jgi:predicted CoA-binding protein